MDLCQTCKHLWKDFPMPLDRVIPHCDVADREFGFRNLDEIVPCPCTECPFKSYEFKEK